MFFSPLASFSSYSLFSSPSLLWPFFSSSLANTHNFLLYLSCALTRLSLAFSQVPFGHPKIGEDFLLSLRKCITSILWCLLIGTLTPLQNLQPLRYSLNLVIRSQYCETLFLLHIRSLLHLSLTVYITGRGKCTPALQKCPSNRLNARVP